MCLEVGGPGSQVFLPTVATALRMRCFSGAVAALRASCSPRQRRGTSDVGTQRGSGSPLGQPERPRGAPRRRCHADGQAVHRRHENIHVLTALVALRVSHR